MNPVAVLHHSGVAVAFAVVLVSYAGPAVGAFSNYCSTRASDRITTCFLDLTKTPLGMRSSGMFVGTSAVIGMGTGTPVSHTPQPPAGIQQSTSDQPQTPNTRDMGIRIGYGYVRPGNVSRVSICERRGDSRHCGRYYEFQLDSNEPADGNKPSSPPGKPPVVTTSPTGAPSSPGNVIPVVNTPSNGPASSPGDPVTVVTTPPADAPSSPSDPITVVTTASNGPAPGPIPSPPTVADTDVLEPPNNDKPDGSGDFQALIPASSFSRLPDDTFVYVYTTFTGNGKCQDGPGDSTCPQPAGGGGPGAAAVPLPSTALLLGLGLAGLARIRRGRSSGAGVSH